MKKYIAPDMDVMWLENVAISTDSTPVVPNGYFDPDDIRLNPDSREYDPEYARNLGLL